MNARGFEPMRLTLRIGRCQVPLVNTGSPRQDVILECPLSLDTLRGTTGDKSRLETA